MKTVNYLIIFIFLFSFSNVFSQESLTDGKNIFELKPYEIGFMVGMASYEGDIVKFEDEGVNMFSSAGIALGLNFTYNFTQNLNFGASYRLGHIKGDDAIGDVASGRRQRGFSFSNNLHELSLRLEYLPLAQKNYKVTPYIYGALGVVLGNPDINYNESRQKDELKARISRDKSEIKKSSIVFPIGFGLKYVINESYSIKAEGALRVGANDYLDGASISASTKYKDYYGIGGVTLCYKFGNTKTLTIKEF